jgi:hypothetical protein
MDLFTCRAVRLARHYAMEGCKPKRQRLILLIVRRFPKDDQETFHALRLALQLRIWEAD